MPSIDIKIIIDVEPAEINGSGKPVGGTSPVTTAIFKSTWIIIIEPMPTAIKKPNLSAALFAIFTIIKNKITNKLKRKITPTKPTSSAIIERIKSDSENGKNRYFWRLWGINWYKH